MPFDADINNVAPTKDGVVELNCNWNKRITFKFLQEVMGYIEFGG